MALEPERTRIPSAIGKIEIELIDHTGASAGAYARFCIDVLDQEGRRIVQRKGSLHDSLSHAELTAMWNFMQSIRSKVEVALLPD